MCQKQHEQSEEDAAGVEAPSEKDSGGEDGVIVEIDCGRGDRQKPARQQDDCRQQEYAAGHEQGFQYSFAPQIQAGVIL